MFDRFCIAFAIALLDIVEILVFVLSAIVMVAFGLGMILFVSGMFVVPSTAVLLSLSLCIVLCALGKMALNYLTSGDSIFDRKKSEMRDARASLNDPISSGGWNPSRRA